MSESPTEEDVHTLCDQLKKACARLGLVAQSVSPTRVRVGTPGAGMLSEVITCKPDAYEVHQWWWSWGAPFCSAATSEIERAAEMIRHVVSPAHA